MDTHEAVFLVGTSGWTYDHWKGSFYPDDLARVRWFEYYAAHFPTVEINATFYGHFKDQTYQKWRDQAPPGFRYVLKAPRLITHRKYLLGVESDIREFWRSAALLEDRLGLILLQIAPGMPYDLERLRSALLAFGDPHRVAVEFRRSDWFVEEIYALLRELGAVFCSVDSPSMHAGARITSDTGYIRLHGREQWYVHDYSVPELEEIAALARRMAASSAKTVYIYFNNDIGGYAPQNALALIRLLAPDSQPTAGATC
jgi:uncharacterized protein YecE (DUF72 family)